MSVCVINDACILIIDVNTERVLCVHNWPSLERSMYREKELRTVMVYFSDQ